MTASNERTLCDHLQDRAFPAAWGGADARPGWRPRPPHTAFTPPPAKATVTSQPAFLLLSTSMHYRKPTSPAAQNRVLNTIMGGFAATNTGRCAGRTIPTHGKSHIISDFRFLFGGTHSTSGLSSGPGCCAAPGAKTRTAARLSAGGRKFTQPDLTCATKNVKCPQNQSRGDDVT